MFGKSAILVITALALVGIPAFWAQWDSLQKLPSRFDTGMTMEKAFKTSKVPLLVEFYSDDCGTCRQVTPTVHEVYEKQYKEKLTLVMVDVTNPQNLQVAQLFGVDEIPDLYVFDFKHMKKERIDLQALRTPETLTRHIETAMVDAQKAKQPAMKQPLAVIPEMPKDS